MVIKQGIVLYGHFCQKPVNADQLPKAQKCSHVTVEGRGIIFSPTHYHFWPIPLWKIASTHISFCSLHELFTLGYSTTFHLLRIGLWLCLSKTQYLFVLSIFKFIVLYIIYVLTFFCRIYKFRIHCKPSRSWTCKALPNDDNPTIMCHNWDELLLKCSGEVFLQIQHFSLMPTTCTFVSTVLKAFIHSLLFSQVNLTEPLIGSMNVLSSVFPDIRHYKNDLQILCCNSEVPLLSGLQAPFLYSCSII